MSKQILLVEYDQAVIDAFRAQFPFPDYDVTVVDNGEKAKEELERRPYHLVVTEAMLPRFHGFNLSSHVAQHYPQTRVILISGIYKGVEYRHQAMTQYKADEFMEKPLNWEKMHALVADLTLKTDPGLSAALPLHPGASSHPAQPVSPPVGEDTSSSLSSADLFGDIINKVEKLPAPAKTAEASQPAPAPQRPEVPDPGKTQAIPRPVTSPPRPTPRPAPTPELDLQALMASGLGGSASPARKKASPPQPESAINLEETLSGIKAPEKHDSTDTSVRRARRIEDEIGNKLEETLSGLGLKTVKARQENRPSAKTQPIPRPVPPPPPPAPPRTGPCARPPACTSACTTDGCSSTGIALRPPDAAPGVSTGTRAHLPCERVRRL